METMEINNRIYNSDLLKGTGLIQETMVLIDLYKEGMSKQELIEQVLQFNPLAKKHSNRAKDIVNHAFYRRFLKDGESSILEIQQLRNNLVSLEAISQILFIYTCRANIILFDFVKEVFQPISKNGNPILSEKIALDFINNAIKDGRIQKIWSESTKQRVSRHINACLNDFRLIDSSKKIIPFFINDLTANYWIHKQHFNGESDQAIIKQDEWELFGLERQDVLSLVERLSLAGNFMFQHAGEVIKINWSYKSMNDFINGITK